mmetsp:Transcript_6684/g.20684  ORF Transcript_6684/g.20684 Transcript_6684/m.20684 type:complete len:471 (-) Transcript_6684:61-1473(-)
MYNGPVPQRTGALAERMGLEAQELATGIAGVGDVLYGRRLQEAPLVLALRLQLPGLEDAGFRVPQLGLHAGARAAGGAASHGPEARPHELRLGGEQRTAAGDVRPDLRECLGGPVRAGLEAVPGQHLALRRGGALRLGLAPPLAAAARQAGLPLARLHAEHGRQLGQQAPRPGLREPRSGPGGGLQGRRFGVRPAATVPWPPFQRSWELNAQGQEPPKRCAAEAGEALWPAHLPVLAARGHEELQPRRTPRAQPACRGLFLGACRGCGWQHKADLSTHRGVMHRGFHCAALQLCRAALQLTNPVPHQEPLHLLLLAVRHPLGEDPALSCDQAIICSCSCWGRRHRSCLRRAGVPPSLLAPSLLALLARQGPRLGRRIQIGLRACLYLALRHGLPLGDSDRRCCSRKEPDVVRGNGLIAGSTRPRLGRRPCSVTSATAVGTWGCLSCTSAHLSRADSRRRPATLASGLREP